MFKWQPPLKSDRTTLEKHKLACSDKPALVTHVVHVAFNGYVCNYALCGTINKQS